MQYQTLLFEVKGSIARITLNRPEASNSMNVDMAKELMQVAMHCSEAPGIRAVIITGKDNSFFCPGGDVKAFNTQGENLPYYLKEMTTYVHSAVSRLTRMDAPLIVAVNGTAAGVGMGLVCTGDIVVAAESARFVVAYTRIGLSPDAGTTYFLPRIVGMRRAVELVLTNRELSAQEAFELGIVTQVVPDAEVLGRADAIAAEMAAGATEALGTSKRLLHTGWNETLETQMENESEGIVNISRTSDTHEGIAAFIEKRKPNFKGHGAEVYHSIG
jgi:2-(1,2-epoxy-1,2-dihydrophenyl)acetyl-CoA isomerase